MSVLVLAIPAAGSETLNLPKTGDRDAPEPVRGDQSDCAGAPDPPSRARGELAGRPDHGRRQLKQGAVDQWASLHPRLD